MTSWIPLLLSFCGVAEAQWWDDQWSDRARLTFDNSQQAEDLIDFPVLVVLDDSTNFDHTAVAGGGDDLRFIDADGSTVLAYEIESWDQAGVSHIWVNVPQIDASSSTDYIRLYYGNPTVGAAGENVAGTWRSSYVGVYHLTGSAEDSSTPDHHGTAQGNASDTAGYLARGYDFDGNNDQVELANESAFDFNTAMTVSLWVKVDAFIHQDWDVLVAKADDSWRLTRCGGGNTLAFSTDWNTGNNSNRDTCGAVNVEDGQWHYVTAVYDSSAALKTLYIDGNADAQVGESRDINRNGHRVWLGNNSDHTGRSLDGQLDEVRMEDVAHSAEWVDADFLSVTDSLITWCSEWDGDADGDGNCDDEDLCPGVDDFLDTDGDGVADCVDPCPLDDPDDSDGDGVCDADDLCPGEDDALDTDLDGVVDCFDPCPLDAPDDSDGDSVCDSDDLCPGEDDFLDTDSDGVVDCLDPCPADAPDDSDGDGVCDSDDLCPGVDDLEDGDGDGNPDCVDSCPLDNPDDSDGDGVCDSDDICPGFDDGLDTDLDGIPNGCDSCALGDTDLDGVPDDCDLCPGFDDAIDADADGNPDGCDPCPLEADELDFDGDGYFTCDDCNDADPSVNPGAYDYPGNGIDDDCDGYDALPGTDTDTDVTDTDVIDTGTDTDQPPGSDTDPIDTDSDPTDDGRAWSPSNAPEKVNPGSGCDCDHGAPHLGWAPGLLFALARRKRSNH